ncbi:MAG TPA: PilZ domain-containing protein [Bradyrhizobium sp.]|nr:PilZ domain-containing protein [Bradyrhizobium sp.]
MSEAKRLYQRVRPSGPAAAKAQIIVGPKLPVVHCRLVDYSAGGACLEIFPMVPVPERFELLHGSVRKRSRVVWRRGVRIGVAF